MKLKLSPSELRRLADLLTESVTRGARTDVALRDRVLEAVHQHTARQTGARERRHAQQRTAGAAARRTMQRTGGKGLT